MLQPFQVLTHFFRILALAVLSCAGVFQLLQFSFILPRNRVINVITISSHGLHKAVCALFLFVDIQEEPCTGCDILQLMLFAKSLSMILDADFENLNFKLG